ncbi:PulJ/GspJ family protein [Domibacillus iocasae]|uniref:Prepilin-type N-terminal cleavage/methylation domain-containing protein n=1 Tax=Domibacillus iocasae TaxID=1714016 RepID=A0A1E7DMJ0_9BACI|nr:prepilin-type N-terminal cleavage/methylation domain-containing protein [Domibacillus iocasae]OES44225.1 hypothetical protein BA724_08000 [Domibacillus iocasae]
MRVERKSEQGITLIEVLAALAILSTILIVITSVQLYGQRQFVQQQEEITVQSDVRTVLKMMTVQIRSADQDSVKVESSQLIAGDSIFSYDASSKELLLNGTVLAENIDAFSVTETAEREINIKIKGIGQEEQSTVLYNQ